MRRPARRTGGVRGHLGAAAHAVEPRGRAREVGLPLAYVNLIGGQDELVFDGNSFVMNAQGEVVMRAPAFEEGLYVTEFAPDSRGAVTPRPGTLAPESSDEA